MRWLKSFNYFISVFQVYEEEGYEDSGYDHGSYTKHGQHETHILSQGQYSNPEIVWGSKSNGGPRFGQSNRTPAPFSKKAVEPSSSFKPVNGRHKYSSRLQSSVSPRVSFEVEDGYPVDSPSKERKSRDLSSFGQDDVGGEVFTHSTASLREIEHQISSLSGSRSDVQTSTRQPHRESTSNSGRKYKEIVRSTSHSQEENGENKKDRALRVNLKEDELNIRHPFLPRDGNGDVHIDYVQSRTRIEPESTHRKYHYKDELTEVTEKPQTTTTPKVTTAKSTTTTTEYTPEDPSKVLKRLKGNVFLSSVFPTLESLEDKIDQHADSPTTTTPKVTTYRGKPTSTTEETSSPETPEETLDRLKSNPFLSSILTSSTQATEEKQRQPKRGIRIKHVVVNPRDSNVMSDSSVKHVEQLTLAQYSGPSHGLMYSQVPTRTQRIFTLAKHLNDEGVEPKHIVVRRSVNLESEKQDESTKLTKETTTEIPVDAKKYPFYYSPASVSFPMLSPIRYSLNPSHIPNKTSNGMEFYESRDRKVRCYEPTPPKDIVPSREKNGDWNKNPRPEKQRLGKLGDQIDCLKVKYFGENPLDNPLFKEENVSIPNFKSPSPKDSLELYYDVVKNIKSFPESTGKLSTRPNKEKEVFRAGSSVHEPFVINPHKEHSNKTSDKSKMTKYIYSSTYRNASKVKTTDAAKSKLSTKLSSLKNKTILSTLPTNKTEPKQNIIEIKEPSNESQEFPVFPITQEVQTGFVPIIPVVLQPPKDVMVSFKSKGTSNHPKIKTAKENPAPYNINIKIVPKGTVGYLQSHNPFHIPDLAASIMGEETMESVKPVFIPDSASSAARTITKVNKQPTTVTYLTINPEGDLLHKHIRTFVPVPSKAPTTTGPHPKYNLEANDQRNWWNLYHSDYERNKPTYRVKRSDENDKYINSKESLELKNYLLQKYKDILAKQSTETSTEQSTSERPSTRAPTSTLRTFPVRSQRPYSSRYTAISRIREIASTEASDEKGGEPPTQRNPPVIRPKLRFPKLNMNTRSSTGGDQAKISSLQEPAHAKTLTTTTTTSPPSTTTRMYKPRMVYRRKEYGRPIEKVTDIFAVLKRQPISSTELSITEPTTEKVKSPDPLPTNRIRKARPHGFERSADRRVSRDRTTRRQGSPHIYNQESSIDIHEHPDLRAPISRSSRNTPESTNNEMLVYMVNPTTGLGEWKVVPVMDGVAVSRMDTRLNGNVNSFQNQNNKRTGSRRRKLRPEPTYEYYKSKYIPKEYNMQEANTPDTNKENFYTTTAIPTKHWDQIRPNPSRSFKKEVGGRF